MTNTNKNAINSEQSFLKRLMKNNINITKIEHALTNIGNYS